MDSAVEDDRRALCFRLGSVPLPLLENELAGVLQDAHVGLVGIDPRIPVHRIGTTYAKRICGVLAKIQVFVSYVVCSIRWVQGSVLYKSP